MQLLVKNDLLDRAAVIAATRLRTAGLVEHPDIGGWLEQLLDEALSPN